MPRPGLEGALAAGQPDVPAVPEEPGCEGVLQVVDGRRQAEVQAVVGDGEEL